MDSRSTPVGSSLLETALMVAAQENMSLRTVCRAPPFSCTSGAANLGVQALVRTSAEGDISLPSRRLGKCCDAPKSVSMGHPLGMSPPAGAFHNTFP
eukprot:2843543-Amphidinium_carterae.1